MEVEYTGGMREKLTLFYTSIEYFILRKYTNLTEEETLIHIFIRNAINFDFDISSHAYAQAAKQLILSILDYLKDLTDDDTPDYLTKLWKEIDEKYIEYGIYDLSYLQIKYEISQLKI